MARNFGTLDDGLSRATPNASGRREEHTERTSLFHHPKTEADIPPADTGKQAWLFLSACWVFEAMIYGFAFSFGIFQDHYSRHEPFAGQGSIAVIGTTTQGILYFATPFVTPLLRHFPRLSRWFSLFGIILATLSLGLASLCNTVNQLIGVQGVLFGVGGCLAYSPCIVYIDEWFDKRKGLAYGIAWSAAGVGGVVIPLVLEVMLDKLGFRTTLRIWAGVTFALTAPFAFFVRPRIPQSMASKVQPLNLRYIFSSTFVCYWLINVLHATGYFLPSIYLPSYASEQFGAPNFLSALTLMVLNICATLGCVIMGFMSDKLSTTMCVFISAVGTSVSVLLIWGLTTKLPQLYVFAILYGLFAGGYTSIYSGIMQTVTQKGEAAGYGPGDPISLMGCLLLGRGIGNLISGPLSEALVKGAPWRGHAIGGYGSGYGPLIVFSGLTAIAGIIVYPLKMLRYI
ncbi:MFS general substrate transporter [Pseudovirgaria hyperparasitica]|uniref:MFS general substrate transporter n=1 Tax=Pseudovirgaria hyperparasitica TaxID=470096 RepID=A0A6A6WJH4_9PEZI|nr:MFS general substrate transporter [Pseudovirgaria hyperparasitica]KAF2762356.1 MFS general substrate transporter [Pseudovirgaria hyperparasitica]